MFNIGDYYYITVGTTEDYSSSNVKVIAWESPLLKYEEHDGDVVILNTSSPTFFKAEKGSSPEIIKAAEQAFFNNLANVEK